MHGAVQTKALKVGSVAAKALAQAASKLSVAEQQMLRTRQEKRAVRHG